MGATQISLAERREMVEKNHPRLSLVQQCILLNICRSGIYYASKGRASADELAVKAEIDRTYTKMPFYGVERMTEHLRKKGFTISPKRVRRYFRDMCISAIYPKPNTTWHNKEHKIYPYLLRGLTIDRVNQVWSTDITYIPMNGGYMYLCAIIDWHSRFVLAWGISNTHDSEFCQELLKEAIARYGKPEIFNTDQGSEFTAKEFVKILEENEIQISMDGKGRALDNIFVERLWRSVKYEYIYLSNPGSGKELYDGLTDYFRLYNTERLHQSLEYKTPSEVYMTAA
ncbi:Mobile element protein [Mucinivorans hirudinis]|uniref:Mobile element protein n=1 Tax=Mucinivorans hirudinis TaxID=1433126 RepID=A0A060RDX2_9BACT|nr:Mobile element protein [Mucinivorans hirudinis]CDN30815.1 Mobile element protein [Mucinivorans hirudinis]CDN31169.1 Mobile element protein [Mucinivorans hirudinis]CDN32578.1 Mobile element protein [Mucinivorans hirudinis]CDN32851.1 Mobile element protein [Mucinivorans hirudinis]